jgi:glyoxylase-like metal-dependent hydrolase (beta-lactamase superfamily II)
VNGDVRAGVEAEVGPDVSRPAPVPVPDTGVGPVPVPGEPVVLAPGLVRLTAPNPGLMTGPGTNTYLIGSGELALIDPGPADESHLAALLAAVEARGTLRTILVTHTHLDHAPGAAALAQATGAQVVGFGPAENFDPDLCVGGGWTLRLPGGAAGDAGAGLGSGDESAGGDLTLEAVHTPGHASDHICWLIQESRTLLTGDHLMHGSTVVIRPPDGDLGTYLASLALVRDFDPPIARLAPGHGRVMERVTEVVDALVAHRLGRHARVADALGAMGEGTVDELLPQVYADVTEAQLPVARFSLWAHLRYLGEESRAEPLDAEPDGDTVETRWRRIADSA